MAIDHRCGPLTQQDMSIHFDYSPDTAAGTRPQMRAEPNHLILARGKWYEMMYFCNKFANDHGDQEKAVAVKAERLIHRVLPASLHSYQEVSKWLLENWINYN